MGGEAQNSKRTVILAGALVILAGVAALMAFRGREEPAQLSTPESADTYICMEDANVFKLTPADFAVLVDQNLVKSSAGMDASSVTIVQCPKCRKITGVRAEQCPKDQTFVARRLPSGQPGKCAKCGWSFYAAR